MLYGWFECKIKYEKMLENGTMKKVTEPFLVDAVNFTDAEKRIIEERQPFMTGEFEVSDIKRAPYKELFESHDEQADKWYKAKLVFITLDEKKGTEKKTTSNVLVQAADLAAALQQLNEGMSGSMMDYTIAALVETPIMDVYHNRTFAAQNTSDVNTPEQ